MKIQLQPPTQAQLNYIEILLNDVQISYEQRNKYLSEMHQRQIRYLDQLTKQEASITIGVLKKWKESLTSRS